MTLNERQIPQQLVTNIIRYRRHDSYKDLTNQITYLKRGYLGEVTLDKWLAVYGSHDWIILRDLFLKVEQTILQVDTILITASTVYIFEVKAYIGYYRLENGGWWFEDKKIDLNPLYQLNRAVENINKIFKSEGIKRDVVGVLAFVGRSSDIEVVDQTRHVILNDRQIVSWIRSVKHQQKYVVSQAHLDERVISAITKYLIPNYHNQQAIDADVYRRLRKGLRCPACGGFEFTTKSQSPSTSCQNCGRRYLKTDLLYQAILEYAILYPASDLTTKAVMVFIDYQLDRKTVIKVLKERLVQLGKGRSSRYRNPQPHFNDLIDEFSLN